MTAHQPIPPLCETSRRTFQQVADWLSRRLRGRARPLLVGVGGPGGCGKSAVSGWLAHTLPDTRVLSVDDFRKPRADRPAHSAAPIPRLVRIASPPRRRNRLPP